VEPRQTRRESRRTRRRKFKRTRTKQQNRIIGIKKKFLLLCKAEGCVYLLLFVTALVFGDCFFCSMDFSLPVVETEGDELRLEEMMARIRELEQENGGNSLPPDAVLALSAMKEEIAALHAEMESLKNDVGAAAAAIQRETAAMLRQVAAMEQSEHDDQQASDK
jgi:hypothetical protein